MLVVGAGRAGLSAGMALRLAGLRFLIVDAGDRPRGSWARYYDRLWAASAAKAIDQGHPLVDTYG